MLALCSLGSLGELPRRVGLGGGADQTASLKKPGGSVLSATYAGASQVERTSAGATTFTNSLLGVTSATEGTATTATTRDPADSLVGLRNGVRRLLHIPL